MAVGGLSDADIQALLGAVGPQLGPNVGGVKRTDLQAFADPSLLVASGLIDPMMIEEMVAGSVAAAEQTALKEWLDQQAAIEAKYQTVEPQLVSEIYSRYKATPQLWNVLGGFFEDIKSGDKSANAVIASWDKTLPPEVWSNNTGFSIEQMQAVADEIGQPEFSFKEFLTLGVGVPDEDVATIEDDLKSFQTDAQTYRNDLLQYNTEAPALAREREAELAKLGQPMFDPAAAEFEALKQYGLEGLNLLPRPSERYNVPADIMLRSRRAANEAGGGRGEMTLAEQQLYEMDRPKAVESGGVRMVGNLAAPVPTVEPVLSRDSLTAKYGQTAQVPAGQQIMGQGFSADARRRAAEARDPRLLAARRVAQERAVAAQTGRAIGAGLAAAGRTPFQDALLQYSLYGNMSNPSD